MGNLPFSARDGDLHQLFAAHGKVASAVVLTDRETGQSRGFGFVEMSAEDAAKAIAALNGRDFGGRALNVSAARERSEGPRGGFGGDRGSRDAGGPSRDFGSGGARSYGGYGARPGGFGGARR